MPARPPGPLAAPPPPAGRLRPAGCPGPAPARPAGCGVAASVAAQRAMTAPGPPAAGAEANGAPRGGGSGAERRRTRDGRRAPPGTEVRREGGKEGRERRCPPPAPGSGDRPAGELPPPAPNGARGSPQRRRRGRGRHGAGSLMRQRGELRGGGAGCLAALGSVRGCEGRWRRGQ